MSAGLVSQHQQSSFATPINGAAGDATVVLGNDNATVGSYNAHDADATIHLQSSSAAVFAATPAGTLGRKWLTNDTGAVYQYYDTGSVWVEVNYLRNTGGTITGNLSVTGTITGTSSSAVALTIGLNGATNPAFTVDASTALQVAGLKVTGAVTGGTVAVVVTDSGSNANLTVNAKGSGTIGIGSVSTGRVTITPATTITGALTQTGLATFNGGATVASGQTLTVTGATITGLTAASVATGTFPGVYTITGALTLSAALVGGASSDITINTNKFTVAASTGNTGVAGTLAVTGTATSTGGFLAAGGSVYSGGDVGFTVTTASQNVGLYSLSTSSPTMLFDHRAASNTGAWLWRNGTGGASTRMTLSSAGDLSVSGITGTTGTFSSTINGQTISSTASFTGTMNVVGNFSVNTNKLTVDASTGDVAAAGLVSATGGLVGAYVNVSNAGTPTVPAGRLGFGGVTQTTVGAAGGASALPLTPRGFWVINVAGTDRVVPFYDKV